MESPILQILLQDFMFIEDSKNTSHLRHSAKIKVLLLEKKEVLFITDGFIIMQAIIVGANEKNCNQSPKPFNRIRTAYYNFNTRLANLFNFNDEDCSHTQPELTCAYDPYKPQFYFQDKLQDFKAQKHKIQYGNTTEILIINEWGIRIVNISNSGYYGIVLQIYSYERNREKYILQPMIHSILYEKALAKFLERLRVKDMRRQIQRPNLNNVISLCYFRKNIKSIHTNKTYQNNFVTIDRNSKHLKTSQQNKHYYIPLGNVHGIFRFIRPLCNYTENKKIHFNFNLFHSPELQITESQTNSQDLWSQQSHDELEKQLDQIEISSSQSQESEQQPEPLKLIYMKQLNKQKLI